MLKGVHHQIVEIRQTDHPYFERALLFVRTDCRQDQQRDWQETAHAFVKRVTPYTGLRKARLVNHWRAALCGIGGTVFGVLLGTFLLK